MRRIIIYTDCVELHEELIKRKSENCTIETQNTKNLELNDSKSTTFDLDMLADRLGTAEILMALKVAICTETYSKCPDYQKIIFTTKRQIENGIFNKDGKIRIISCYEEQ